MFAASKCVAFFAMLVPVLALAATAGGTTMKIHVQPGELRLAEGGRVRVRVASPKEAPLLSVSVGRIEGLREVSSGIYEAEYAPPDSVDPQIAFVTAATSGGDFGWGTIALEGVRTVTVKAPHRKLVSVRVAGQSYGPIPADGTGRAVLRVNVPPGVYSATSLGKQVNLDVPRNTFSHVALDRASVPAEDSAAVTVRVLALDQGGKPLTRAPVKLEATDGKLSKPVEKAPGVFHATWALEPGPVRQAHVTARVGSRPPSTATASLARVAGAPAAVRLETAHATLVAGEADELEVTGRVVDGGGNATDAPARLLVSLGTGPSARLLPDAVIEWQQRADATYYGRVQAPRQRSGRQQLELRMIGPGGLSAARIVDLVPGPAANVRVESDEVLYADGHRRQLRVVLLDKYGNHTEADGKAEITAVRGSVGAPVRTAAGVYVADYRSPLSSSDYSDVIKARVGPLQGQTEVRVRARGGSVVLGVKGGYAVGSGSLSSPSGGVEIGYWRPTFGTTLGLVLDVHYFSFGSDQTLTAGSVSLPVSSDASFLALEPSIAWRLPLASGTLWLGAGPGLVRTSSAVSAPGQDDLTATSWVPSAHASVGWGLPIGPGIPFVELKGGWQGEADEAPVSGSVQTLTFALGYRFDVF